MFRTATLLVTGKKNESEFFNTMEHMNWLTLAEKYELMCLRFFYNNVIKKSNLTVNLSPLFLKKEAKYDLRHSSNYEVPLRKEIGRASFSYQTILMWNNLPPDLKDESHSPNIFEARIRSLLLEHRDDNIAAPKTRILCNNTKL